VRLLGRIIVEKRVALLAILLAIVANVVVYAFVVHPMETRVSSAEARKAAAERNRRAAERELGEARAAQEGKQRAELDLQKFYRQVLPTDLPAARKAVYVRLAQIARQCNIKYERQTAEEVRDQRQSDLTRLQMKLVLDGSYEDVRLFLHALETAPEFLIVDNMGLLFRDEANAPLAITLTVSTYFWTGDHET
jgi:Tfp pilus assembly protein PilO